MNPLIRFYIFFAFAISIFISKNITLILFHFLFINIYFFLKKRIFFLWKDEILKFWLFFPLSSFIFFTISFFSSNHSLIIIIENVFLSTFRYFLIISFTLVYFLKSKNDDLLLSIKNLIYKFSFKSIIINQTIIFFDLMIRFYPNTIKQWKNLIRGQNALSNNPEINYLKKIKTFAINIPDFILINLWRTEKLSTSMKMRGYGNKLPMSSYPILSLRTFDLRTLLVTLILLFGFHFAF